MMRNSIDNFGQVVQFKKPGWRYLQQTRSCSCSISKSSHTGSIVGKSRAPALGLSVNVRRTEAWQLHLRLILPAAILIGTLAGAPRKHLIIRGAYSLVSIAKTAGVIYRLNTRTLCLLIGTLVAAPSPAQKICDERVGRRP